MRSQATQEYSFTRCIKAIEAEVSAWVQRFDVLHHMRGNTHVAVCMGT